MMINQDTLSGKWKEVKGEIQKKWGQLTENDMESTKGNAHSLIGLIQQKVGIAKDEATQYIHEMTERFKDHSAGTESKIADKANSAIDSAKTEIKKH